jgi:hypothetical protein
MNRLMSIAVAVLMAACTFNPDLTGEDYWPCRPDGTCPPDCECLEGQVCIQTDGLDPKLCAWCPEGYTLCDMHLPDEGCARLLSDPRHCGNCNHACPEDFVCEYGACVEWCREGLDECDGACVDLESDPQNCGWCGHACRAGDACGFGNCEEGCPSGTENCDGSCVNPLFDPANCGECGNVCSLANATAHCDGGACAIFECLDCYRDCDQQAHNGCETCPESDPNNCGECGIVCDDPPPPVCEMDDLIIHLDTGDCVDGQCKYQSSPKPCEFGCENGVAGATCKDDPCLQVDCNLNQHCEDGLCVCDDLYADCDTSNLNGCETYINTVENCGACGFDCGANSVCNNGTCECEYGFGDCDNNWETGCEEDLLYNEEYCGTCLDSCLSGLTCCSGVCVDTNTDNGNCGGCMTFCAGMRECCGGTCIDTQMDPENCGECGNVCTFPIDTCCYASCVDIRSDPGNCGDCGNDCAVNQPCHQGACGIRGIHCADTDCDFFLEECCDGARGIACYPEGTCSARIVQCDDDSDCGDLMYCCLVDTPEHITICTGTCTNLVCSSDAYCSNTNPDNPHCCAGDYHGQTVNTCTSEFCR